MKVDYQYLARSVARLSGIPVRVYRGEDALCRFFPAALPRDPMALCREELFAIASHVGTYTTSALFHSYGVLNAGGTDRTPQECDYGDAVDYAHDIIGDLNGGMQRWIRPETETAITFASPRAMAYSAARRFCSPWREAASAG